MDSTSLADKLKELRTRAGLTQRSLAQDAGVTSAFVAQIEAHDRTPSLDVLLRLAEALQLKRAEQEELMSLYEQAQNEKHQRAVRTRGAAVRGVLRTRGGATKESRPVATQAGTADVNQLAREIAADPDLLSAHQHLQTALADPQLRLSVLTALEAFARAARTEPTE